MLRGCLAFMLLVPLVWAVVLFAYVGWTVLAGYQDREGALGMGVAFFYAPVISVVLGLAGAVLFARKAQ